MDFDPITGILWNTELGHWINDEINIVRPGFNSGYGIVQDLSKYFPAAPLHLQISMEVESTMSQNSYGRKR